MEVKMKAEESDKGKGGETRCGGSISDVTERPVAYATVPDSNRMHDGVTLEANLQGATLIKKSDVCEENCISSMTSQSKSSDSSAQSSEQAEDDGKVLEKRIKDSLNGERGESEENGDAKADIDTSETRKQLKQGNDGDHDEEVDLEKAQRKLESGREAEGAEEEKHKCSEDQEGGIQDESSEGSSNEACEEKENELMNKEKYVAESKETEGTTKKITGKNGEKEKEKKKKKKEKKDSHERKEKMRRKKDGVTEKYGRGNEKGVDEKKNVIPEKDEVETRDDKKKRKEEERDREHDVLLQEKTLGQGNDVKVQIHSRLCDVTGDTPLDSTDISLLSLNKKFNRYKQKVSELKRKSMRESFSSTTSGWVGNHGKARRGKKDDKLFEALKNQLMSSLDPKLWVEMSWDLEDDGMRCEVCGAYDSTEDDAILICDGCDVTVHQTCYGVDEVPADSWYCMPCEAKIEADEQIRKIERDVMMSKNEEESKSVTAARIKRLEAAIVPPVFCPLCPQRSGAFILCKEGVWVHAACALWLPECVIFDSRTAEGVGAVKQWRFDEVCEICQWSEGAVVSCSAKGCHARFHPVCGRMAGYGMNLIGQIHLDRGSEETRFKAFCYRHRHTAYKESVDVDKPLEYRTDDPDFDNPLVQCANLIRRNRDVLNEVDKCQREDTPWAWRMSAYLLKDANENMAEFQRVWGEMVEKVKKDREGEDRRAIGVRSRAISSDPNHLSRSSSPKERKKKESES